MKTIEVLIEALCYWTDEEVMNFLAKFDCKPEDMKNIFMSRKKVKEEDIRMSNFITSIAGADEYGQPYYYYGENPFRKGEMTFLVRHLEAEQVFKKLKFHEDGIRKRIEGLPYLFLREKYSEVLSFLPEF